MFFKSCQGGEIMANACLKKLNDHYHLLIKQAEQHDNPVSFYKFELQSLETDLKQIQDSSLDENEKLTKKILLSAVSSSLLEAKTDA